MANQDRMAFLMSISEITPQVFLSGSSSTSALPFVSSPHLISRSSSCDDRAGPKTRHHLHRGKSRAFHVSLILCTPTKECRPRIHRHTLSEERPRGEIRHPRFSHGTDRALLRCVNRQHPRSPASSKAEQGARPLHGRNQPKYTPTAPLLSRNSILSSGTTIVCAYLMRCMNMSLREAYLQCKVNRPICFPNLGFWNQLIAYEQQLTKQNTVKSKTSTRSLLSTRMSTLSTHLFTSKVSRECLTSCKDFSSENIPLDLDRRTFSLSHFALRTGYVVPRQAAQESFEWARHEYLAFLCLDDLTAAEQILILREGEKYVRLTIDDDV